MLGVAPCTTLRLVLMLSSKTQFSQRTPTQTQRYEPQSAAKKKKLSSSSVSAFATAPVTVVSDNVVHYVDLKQHFLKKLGEM